MRVVQGGHQSGEVIGSRTLVAYSGLNGHGHHMWLWSCNFCGRSFGPSTLSHLRRSNRCVGCGRSGENSHNWCGYEQIKGEYLHRYESDARKRGLAWAITAEQLWQKWTEQEGCCAYTGWLLTHGTDASIDRIRNAEGYVPGNVQWVHRDINYMKRTYSEVYFLKLCLAVADRLQGDL